MPLFPAIAIPVVTKRDYECPDKHIECLRGLLPQTRTILSIGWRGMEKHFLKMLADSFAGKLPIDVYAVAANSTAAEQVLAQFHDAGISVKGRHYDKGFTEFVKSRLAEAFCGQEVRLQAPLTGDVDEPLPKIVVNRDFDARRSTSHFDPRSNKNN